MKVSVPIPKIFQDTRDGLSEEMRSFFFANTILLILNSLDFSKETIERKCLKGVKREEKDKGLTTKQINLISWIYILNKLGKNTFEMKKICAGIEEIQGIPFLANPHDLSVWFTNIGDFLVRDKKAVITRVKPTYEAILDKAFEDGVFDTTIAFN